MTSIGSPGVRWISVNTPAVTNTNTGTVASRRRRMRRPTGGAARLLQPDRPHPHHAIRNRLIALHAQAERLRLDRMDDVHHRQLLLQDLRQLAEELLALRLARDLARLVEQRVDLRVGDAGPVERDARRGLEELVRVAIRIGTARPLVADHVEVLAVAVGELGGSVHELDLDAHASLGELG